MAISKEEFKQALREAVSKEFAHIPQDEDSIDYTFSKGFNKRMERLIKAQKRPYYRYINTAAKRAAVIFVAVLTVFSAAFSVEAVREPVVNFITEVYETFVKYLFEGDTTEKITKEYSITSLPDGFKMTSKIVDNKNSVIISYENETGDCIEFTQMATHSSIGHFADKEQGIMHSKTINGMEIMFLQSRNVKRALWINGEYVFRILCYGDVSIDQIEQMIISVE